MVADKDKRRLKIVEVSGNHYEMGYQYGVACPEISKMVDMTHQMFGGRDKTGILLKKFVPLYLTATEKYAPEVVEEIKGMAAGANVNFEDIFFLNITYEISVPSVMEGCTSYAAGGEATHNGKVIAGQNFDYIKPWDDFVLLLKMNPSQGPRFMAVTAAGCLGLLGISSAGMSVNLNLLRNKNSLTPHNGVPTHVILRKIFMSENIGEAITAIATAEGRSAKNYLLTTGQGDIINIETTTNDLDIQYAERGIYTHANCFKADRFKSTDVASLFFPDAYVRSQRLFQLMERHHGSISVDVMKQILQDHNNYPDSICRHPNPRAPLPIGKIMKTVASIISCPKEQKVHISLGNPCENDYFEYQL